jgi:hypothetical protein
MDAAHNIVLASKFSMMELNVSENHVAVDDAGHRAFHFASFAFAVQHPQQVMESAQAATESAR